MSNFNIIAARNGAPILEPLIINSEKICINSLYNPQQEAQRIINSLSINFEKKEVFIFFGLGLGYYLSAFIDRLQTNLSAEKFKKIKILIIEKHKEIIELYNNFALLEIKEKINKFNVLIYTPQNENDVLYFLAMHINFSNFYKLQVINIPNLTKLDEKYYLNALVAVEKYLEFVKINLSTTTTFAKLWINNEIENIKNLSEFYDISRLQNFYAGKPAVIVSAGPSLTKQLPLLKRWRNHFFLFAVDTALKALADYDIIADFVCVADAQKRNADLITDLSDYANSLIASLIAHPKIFVEFKKKKKIVFNSKLAVDNLLTANNFDITFVKSGGSVATSLFSVLTQIKSNPIIFVGQDLALTDMLTHSKNTLKFQEYFNTISKFHTMETIFFMLNTDLITIKDINDNFTFTNELMKNYCRWFEVEFAEHKNLTIINATGAGILKKNCIILDFQQAMEKYCKNEVLKNNCNVDILLKDSDTICKKRDLDIFFENIIKQIKELLTIKDVELFLIQISNSQLNELLTYPFQFELLNIYETNDAQAKIELVDKIKNYAIELLEIINDR